MKPQHTRTLTMRSRVRDLLATPVGRDVVDKVLLFSGAPRWVLAPVRHLRLGTIDRLTRRWTGVGTDGASLVEVVLRLATMPVREAGQAVASGPEPWWKSAVFYQIYPASFADSNGDGIGDLRGIIEHLDHLVELDVDCLWLSPIFDSPGRDQGYDIRDYRSVLAAMGTMDDLDELIDACHSRGLRIILDLVVNHTSVEHPWFQRAITDPSAPERGYYFFRDGQPDTPPNNWRSFFSGPAWTWSDEAGAWVLHLFDASQVDLDWSNPSVRDEVAAIVRFWLDRGIDGFRMDVINYISKAPGLPDGHPFVERLLEFTGIEHYFHGPQLHEHLAELRREGFTRADGSTAVMIGETPGIGVEIGRLLSGAGRGELDLVFNFDGLDTPGHTRWDDYRYDLRHLVDFWLDANVRSPDAWVALFVENHDNPRIVSKVLGSQASDPALRAQVAKLIGTIELTMRGTAFLFQGQELGAINEPFTGPDQLRDVESLNRLAGANSDDAAWTAVLAGSRDHARTPVRWTEHQDDSAAWLPGHERTPGFSVAAQRADPDSVLAWYRSLIALRHEHSALSTGDLTLIRRGGHLVVWQRSDAESTWLVEVNLGPRARRRLLRPDGQVQCSTSNQTDEHRISGWSAIITKVGPAR